MMQHFSLFCLINKRYMGVGITGNLNTQSSVLNTKGATGVTFSE